MIKRTHIIAILILFGSQLSWGQQDPMFTKYFFNTLVYNPAYAGSREHLSIVALAREQWVGWNSGATHDGGGAPRSQTFTIHGPLQERVGVGLSLFNDQIGANRTTGFHGSYAYRIPFGGSKLAIGVNAGVANWRADWDELTYRDARVLDPSFAGENPTRWIPTIGTGVYFYNEDYYFGFSIPRLINYDLRPAGLNTTSNLKIAKAYRHYYLTAGAAFPLKGDDLVFKPSFLLKSVGLFSDFKASSQSVTQIGAPTEIEIDASLLFYQKLWLGVAFRTAFEEVFNNLSSHDSADIWAAFYLNNGLRVGFAYDFPLSTLNSYTVGSFELLVGYDFEYKVQRVLTPRYF